MALTTAYAGHADITSENAGAILNQFLPQDPPDGVGLGLVYIPERVTRAQGGLKRTIAWLEEELGGSDATIPVPDLIAAMLTRKEAEGDDLELYLLFDENNADDVELANAANDAGIPVRNLAGAGDFLVFEDADDETPPFDTEEAVTDPAAGHPHAHPADVVSQAMEIPIGPGIRVVLDLSPETLHAIAAAIVEHMGMLGAQQVAAQASANGATAPASDGKPAEPVGRTTQEPGTSAYYYHAAKATYRKARGMARDGESKVFLTEAEADDARKAKMLA